MHTKLSLLLHTRHAPQDMADPVVVSAVETTQAAALAVQAGTCLDVLQIITENATAQLRSGKAADGEGRRARIMSGSSASTQKSSSSQSPQMSLSSPLGQSMACWPGVGPLQLPGGGAGWGGGLQGPGVSAADAVSQQQIQQQQQAVQEQVIELIQAVWQVLQPILPELQVGFGSRSRGYVCVCVCVGHDELWPRWRVWLPCLLPGAAAAPPRCGLRVHTLGVASLPGDAAGDAAGDAWRCSWCLAMQLVTQKGV